jgi:hypothetical protein
MKPVRSGGRFVWSSGAGPARAEVHASRSARRGAELGRAAPSRLASVALEDTMIERRTRRCENAYTATQLYLEGCAERHGCAALALVSDDGLLIAGVGADVERVGAVASSVATRWNEPLARSFGRPLQAFSFNVGRHRVHVGALGAIPEGPCVESLGRILGPCLGATA